MPTELRRTRLDGPLIRALCLLGALLVIAQLFSQGANPDAADLIPSPWDKFAHFLVYSAITVLLWFGTAGRMTIAVLFIVAATGALDELHQATIPGRVADSWDFVTNLAAGTATAIALLVMFRTDRASSTHP